VSETIGEALKTAGKVDVAILCTGSTTAAVAGTLRTLIAAGIPVVSSCEELAYPPYRSQKLAQEIDALAAKKGVAVLGTGVNPGFAMDAFALACTAVCASVKGIKVVRTLDARMRRYQLQKKVGAGMSLADAKKLAKQNSIGHVGLAESVAMIAAGLGWKLQRVEEKTIPVVAKTGVKSEFFEVKKGQVRGMQSIASGYVGGKEKIVLDLTMALGAETYDEVQIDAMRPIVVRAMTGFPGDTSTTAILVNAAMMVGGLAPGVRTMMDVLKIRSVGG